MRVLDVVKGKYGLKNRNQALRKFVQEYGEEYAEITVKEEVLADLDKTAAEHKQHGLRTMSEEELDELLGL